MNPTSVPVNPQQPSQAEYPATDLQTVQTYPNAQAYQQAFGVAPPSFDTTRPVQYWFDSTASTAVGAVYQYNALGTDALGNPVIIPQLIPAVWALTPNIPLPATVYDIATTPVQPVPVRALLADEQLFLNDLLGIETPYVLNTTLQGTLPATYTQGDKAIVARLGAYLTKQGA